MSTYDKNLTLDRDKVRFLIGDTDNDFLMLEDSEIAYILTGEGDDVLKTASRCCLTIASKFARDVNYRFSTMWQDSTEAYNHYIELSKMYAVQAEQGSESALDLGFQMSPAMTAKVAEVGYVEEFWIGMNDNPIVDPAAD